MDQKIKEKSLEALSSVLPITGIVLVLSVTIVPMDLGIVIMFFVGALMLVLGMGLFQLGAEISMTPLGRGIGTKIAETCTLPGILLISFLVGAVITMAEPDLQVLANQVPAIPNRLLIIMVAAGVGFFLALAVVRIVFRIGFPSMIAILYAVVMILSFFIPGDFVAVAFDSGGVTTGPVTVPFIMAMGVGLTCVRSDTDAINDSFGLVALSSVGPILAVMLLGCFFRPGETSYIPQETARVETTRDVVKVLFQELPHYMKEVLVSIFPILVVFVVFTAVSHRRRHVRKNQIKQMLIGFGYTFVGLVLFLCGVNVGFSPVGTLLGQELAGLRVRWLLVPIGMLVGYYLVKAEPAIQILNRQVQDVTSGVVSGKSMNYCLSIGVAVSVGLAMMRILTGISIYWIVIPGYCIALVLSRLVPRIFVGIAFDSGGVASGPMTTTFLLPLSIGACEALGGNLMTDAFGVVALVALTPLIAIQIMGLQYKYKLKKMGEHMDGHVESVDDDEIIDLGEYGDEQ